MTPIRVFIYDCPDRQGQSRQNNSSNKFAGLFKDFDTDYKGYSSSNEQTLAGSDYSAKETDGLENHLPAICLLNNSEVQYKNLCLKNNLNSRLFVCEPIKQSNVIIIFISSVCHW